MAAWHKNSTGLTSHYSQVYLSLIPYARGTAQLQGNIRTHPECAFYISQECPACVLDVTHIRSSRVP